MDLIRDRNGVAQERLEENTLGIANEFFVRIESDESEFGILRYTTHERDWTGILDGRAEFGEDSSHTWIGGAAGVMIDRVSQTNTEPLEVSAISFANVVEGSTAGPWTARDLQYGLKNRVTTIWSAWWDSQTDRHEGLAVAGAYIVYQGKIGSREHGVRSNLALLPFGAIWNTMTGSLESASVCRFAVAGLYGNTGEAAETCQVGSGPLGSFTTCGGTIQECIDRENEIHFGGNPLMLKPNTPITVGTQKFRV